MSANHGEKSSKRSRLIAQQKCFAFRSERIFSLFATANPSCGGSILFQEPEADQCVHDRTKTTLRCACLFTDLLDRFRSVTKRIEHFVLHRRADNQRRRISESQLHQTFGSNLLFLSFLHLDWP